jgi:hypothetical protein
LRLEAGLDSLELLLPCLKCIVGFLRLIPDSRPPRGTRAGIDLCDALVSGAVRPYADGECSKYYLTAKDTLNLVFGAPYGVHRLVKYWNFTQIGMSN